MGLLLQIDLYLFYKIIVGLVKDERLSRVVEVFCH